MSSLPSPSTTELERLLQLVNTLVAEQDQIDAQEEQTEYFYRRATNVSLGLLGLSAFVLALETTHFGKVFWTYVMVALAVMYFAGATVWLWRRSSELRWTLDYPKRPRSGTSGRA